MARGKKYRERYEGGQTWKKRSLVAAWRGMPVERTFRPAKGVGQLAAELLKRLRLDDQLDLEEVMREWKAATGEPFASSTRPVALRHGTLIVAVSHPTLHYSIRGMEKNLLLKLQEKFGGDRIRGLKFSHGG